MAYAQHPGVPISDLLARRVLVYRVRNESRLNALVRFSRENGIPLGIEFSTAELDEPVNVNISATDVRGVIGAILGASRRYSLSSSHGTVAIRAADFRSPIWLDRRIRHFRLPRTQIALATAMLLMTLEVNMAPATKGFAGDYPPGDPSDRAGPIDIRGVTVRELLNRIVGASGHSSWIVTRQGARIESPASVNRFWTTMYRPDPLSQLPGVPIPHLERIRQGRERSGMICTIGWRQAKPNHAQKNTGAHDGSAYTEAEDCKRAHAGSENPH